MTYRDIISEVRSMDKLLNSDDTINDRTVLAEVRDGANLIVGQSLSRRKYWQSPTLFTPIQCLEMEAAPLRECCEYTGDRTVSISKKSLPKIGEGTFGLAVQGVFGLDGTIKFNPTNPNRYSNLIKLDIPGKDKFYWIRADGRVVVTKEDAKYIDVFAYFTEMVPNDLLFPGGDCKCKIKPSIQDLCANPLDQQFYFISERLFDLKQLVYKNLMTTYFSNRRDITTNQVDETGK